ncbi:hypothetical protein DNHGIG_10040 [Collibacillus ludicampi]|uniref:Permease n=1 Tax=Collibacillus ludicampi TaxID=2771369 RepID=A0AAV4LCB8_9BACL|nr:hypothetical protein [Collibacillus ludicampi]GIM45455.1 hypothetical protein DNHGIG_10040 [Collibacillus ludicampi]
MKSINWRHPSILNCVLIGIIAAIVILAHSLVFVILSKWWYSFWLFLFFITFIPLWLLLYGFFWSDRFKWYEMMIGTLWVTFLMSLVYLESNEMIDFRFMFSVLVCASSTLSVMFGFLLRKVSQRARRFFQRREKEERKDEGMEQSSNRGTSIGG